MENYEEICGQKVGYAYVPIQKLGELYSTEEGLMRGTIFPELDIPMSEYSPTAR